MSISLGTWLVYWVYPVRSSQASLRYCTVCLPHRVPNVNRCTYNIDNQNCLLLNILGDISFSGIKHTDFEFQIISALRLFYSKTFLHQAISAQGLFFLLCHSVYQILLQDQWNLAVSMTYLIPPAYWNTNRFTEVSICIVLNEVNICTINHYLLDEVVCKWLS